MKKVLIDTNVALDYLLHRPDYSNAMIIYLMAEQNIITAFISASAITDIFYIASKELGKKVTRENIKQHLVPVFKLAAVTDNHIYQALDIDWSDFEDSVQYIVGESISADYIVTRNTQDFTSGSIPVVTPEDFIKQITKNEAESN